MILEVNDRVISVTCMDLTSCLINLFLSLALYLQKPYEPANFRMQARKKKPPKPLELTMHD